MQNFSIYDLYIESFVCIYTGNFSIYDLYIESFVCVYIQETFQFMIYSLNRAQSKIDLSYSFIVLTL